MGGGPDTITQQSGPPAYASPYHVRTLQLGQQAAAQPFQPYPGAQVAGFTPEQEMGLNAMAMRGMQGSPVDQVAQQQAVNTLQGSYLNPQTNVPLQDMLNYGQRQVMTNYGAQLGRNFGNSGVQEMIGDAMGRSVAGLYDAERGRQMQTMAFAPQLAERDYRDIQAVMDAGGARQAQLQGQLDVPGQSWQQAMLWPQHQLGLMGQALGAGSVGGTSTQPNPYAGNTMQNVIGGGATGAAIGSMMAPAGATGLAAIGGAWPALIGAGLGLLMS